MKKGRAKMQAFGGFLTAMVIPNMGAFIVWGFITALFIPSGWIPNENFNKLVSPILMYMLPLLLAYTGGTLVNNFSLGIIGFIVCLENFTFWPFCFCRFLICLWQIYR